MHKNLIPLTGRKFGRLLVLGRNGEKTQCKPRWICQCDCGVVKVIVGKPLREGKTQSCGCLHRELLAERNRKEDCNSKNILYRLWKAMRHRCYCPTATSYRWYGGRGIKVCDRWHNFSNFVADMPPRPSSSHQIHRQNNDGDYEPDNCVWLMCNEHSRLHNAEKKCTSLAAKYSAVAGKGL